MKRIKLKNKITSSVIDKTAKSLTDGIVILPTGYNYVLVSNDQSRLRLLKQDKKPIFKENQKLDPARFILKSDISLASLNEPAKKIISQFFPGPLIALIPDSKGKIGISASDSQLINTLIERLKVPLYFIETEISPHEWGRNQVGEFNELTENISLFVESDITNPISSTIIDLSEPIPVILKKGAIPILEIEKFIHSRIKLSNDVYFSVLLVCSGNSCRSPMAKGILEKKLEKKNVFVFSAGTIAHPGSLPSEFAILAAQKYGTDISHHLSAPLTRELINGADLILVMSPKHKDRVIELVPKAQAKTFLLKEYALGIPEEIEDPIGQPLEVFERVAAIINESLEKVAQEIKERLN
ncbi:MAG: Sua5/YciO/YrdC/YwlC family protein [bacterium]